MTSDETLDLLIVGAGPAGLLASMIASMTGLSHRVIERRSGLHTEPSAHVLKTHTMEVYRRVGAAGGIIERGTPAELMRYITWCESVGGLAFGRLDLTGMRGNVPRYTGVSAAHPVNLAQSLLEPLLHRRAIDLAGRDPVSFDTAFVDAEQDKDGVSATIEDAAGRHVVRARYLIGADGASSQVRRSAGIAMQGPPSLAHFLAIHINSDMMPFLERHPGILYFVRSPKLEGFLIVHQPVGSQVFMMRYDPDTTPFTSFDADTCRAIIEQLFGEPHAFKIAAIDRWVMSAQIAERYREGRILLVGDAGHRFPPTGGLGLNTGVEDVENLLWKLHAVLRGYADEALLDSYEVESRPTAVRNTKQSVSNNQRMSDVTAAMWADRAPQLFQESIDELIAAPDHPRFAEIQARIEDQLDHFAFLGLEMAATIDEGAFIPANREIARPVPLVEGFCPSFQPGGFVPHLWLEPGVATIDVLRFDRFTLLVPDESLDLWQRAVAGLPAGTMPIDVHGLSRSTAGEQASADDYWGATPYAVLVRPDGRIGWVEPVDVGDRCEALAAAITTLLCGGHVPAIEAAA